MLTQAARRGAATVDWDRILAHIVVKNLYAHRPRNQKTAAMFTLCVGFVIFAATMFVLQAQSIPENLEWAAGADIVRIFSLFAREAVPRSRTLTVPLLRACRRQARPDSLTRFPRRPFASTSTVC